MAENENVADTTPEENSTASKTEKKREIKGGLPYSTSPGTFKKALEGIILAERPERFSGDFIVRPQHEPLHGAVILARQSMSA